MTRTILDLQEEQDLYLDRDALSSANAEAIYTAYGDQFEVDFPSPINRQRYRLRSKGYVGNFPVNDQVLLRVLPKVPVASLFHMLEYAYDLESFRLYDSSADTASINDVFETLALVLARRILDRIRRGLHRDYIERQDDLPYVRGRLLFRDSLRQSLTGTPRVVCEFDDHTPELEDNHILAWTLHVMRRFPFERDEVQSALRKARQSLRMTVDLNRVNAADCVNRYYHRFNHDYQPMHALCRFFLEQCGPKLDDGERDMMPFSLYMPSLFEAFVARWLEQNLPAQFGLQTQYHARLDDEGHLSFRIDMVIEDRTTGATLAVLDTKYKDATRPSQSDVQQIVAYATRMRTTRAVLIYPATPGGQAFSVGDVAVSPIGFDLSANTNTPADRFVASLSKAVGRDLTAHGTIARQDLGLQ